jgi:hypothetical protein
MERKDGREEWREEWRRRQSKERNRGVGNARPKFSSL